MTARRFALTVALLAASTGLIGGPSRAATTHKGVLAAPAFYWYYGDLGTGAGDHLGSPSVSSWLFNLACRADRAAHANGQSAQATNVARFVTSPFNGLDAWVVDLKTPKMGAFSAVGPGSKQFGPAVGSTQHTEYDLDLDFYTDTSVDASSTRTTCAVANDTPSSSHRCYAHKPTPDERPGCITGYKDSKGKAHGARYVVVNGSLNLRGASVPVTLTTP